jgi:secondary thiamine-phosphate synthase enzyme
MPQTIVSVATSGQGLYEITQDAEAFVAQAQVEIGLLTAFVRHTSASLLVQENADPDVRRDLLAFFCAARSAGWRSQDELSCASAGRA